MDADLPAGAESVAVCAPDNAGRLIGKTIPAGRWKSVLAEGLPMPNFHLITGIENVPLDGLTVTGPHRGFPNGLLRPCPETMCLPPWEPGSALVLSDVEDGERKLVEQAPRSILSRQVACLQDAGLTATFASELEFYLFSTSYAEAWASGYRDLEADRHVIYKHGVKAMAQERGLSATFMAKPFTARAGSSCHVHLCLYDRDGGPLLGVGALSPVARSFLAGLLAYGPEFTVLHAPYANSYRRLQPGSFARCRRATRSARSRHGKRMGPERGPPPPCRPDRGCRRLRRQRAGQASVLCPGASAPARSGQGGAERHPAARHRLGNPQRLRERVTRLRPP